MKKLSIIAGSRLLVGTAITVMAIAANESSAAAAAAGDLKVNSCISADTPTSCKLQYVDARIGTGGHGHVFYGANVPFGLVQLGPSQVVKGWDWCSGYHDSDSTLLGFSHTHLSGTGIGDLGDFLFTPAAGTLPATTPTPFSKDKTTVTPGYYRTEIPDNNITVELTATEHTGMHRYTAHSPSDTIYLRLNLRYGIGWDKAQQAELRTTGAASLSGYRISRGWAPDHHAYFTVQFSRPISAMVYESKDVVLCKFAPNPHSATNSITAKVGISAVSEPGAAANLVAENPYWDFDAVKAEAHKKWGNALNRVDFHSDDPAAMRKFYTALYHTMFAPVLFSDVNGDYRGADGKIHSNPSMPTYSIFSLWDTYRAAHPLYSLILPEMQPALAQTFVNIYKEQGRLPVWHLHGNETDCMVGNPGAIVLADLLLKGMVPDAEEAYKALRETMMGNDRSLDELRQYGYIPYDGRLTKENVAKGLEYAIAFDAVAKAAAKLGKEEDAELFGRLGQSYREYFDPRLGFMRGKSKDGKFRNEPYSPFLTAHRDDDYCEGNGWQYTWLVPHDPRGLISLFGSDKKFLNKLDSLFIVQGDLGSEASPDISGFIGQYAHGNEPSHHTLYLYNYAGRPDKAAPYLRQVMTDLYHDQPDGLCGNEDVGQMSAWYILSALGLYQVEPAGGKYVIGTPVCSRASIQTGNDKTFTVEALNNSDKNIYVQSAQLNGRPLHRSWLTHAELTAGGTLTLQMGPKPSKFGAAKSSRP